MPNVVDPRDRPLRVVVVGAGISGLSAALRLSDAGADVVVLDGDSRVGGKLRTGEVAGQPVDVGAEALLNRRPEGVALIRESGLGGDLVHPTGAPAALWARGGLRALPRTLMGIPCDPDKARHAGVLDRDAVARARHEAELGPPDLGEDVSIGRLVAERLGPDVRDLLVEPLLGGVYAGRADDISVHAAVPSLVSGVQQHGSLLAAAAASRQARADPRPQPPVFAGVVGGVGRLPGAVAGRLTELGHTVRVGAMVRDVRRTSAGWVVVSGPTTGPRTDEADAVVLATPAPATARLLAGVAPGAAGRLAGIDHASMALVTLAYAPRDLAPGVRHRMSGSGFLVPPVEGRIIKAATHASSKWDWLAGDHVVVRCSIGRAGEERALQRTDAELVQAALGDLASAVGLRARPVDTAVTRWGGALPQYTVGHLDRVAGIRAEVADVTGLEVCGAAYGGVGIPACIADGQAAATRLLDGCRPA